MDDPLRGIGEALGYTHSFQRWCAQRGVTGVDELVALRVDPTLPGQAPWQGVPQAIREAVASLRRRRKRPARAALRDLLDRPRFRARFRVDDDVDARVEQLLRVLQTAETARLEAKRARLEARKRRTAEPPSAENARKDTAMGQLRLAGGVAGARFLADRLEERLGARLTARDVRDRLRSTQGVRKLGAGYYCLAERNTPEVLECVELTVAEVGTMPVDEVIAWILSAWPHGDERAVRAWLRQDPGRLVTTGGSVTVEG